VFGRSFESASRQVVASYDLPLGRPGAGPAAVGERDVETLRPMVEAVKALDPQGIYIAGYVQETATLLRQLHDAGVAGLRMGTSSFTDAVARQAGDAAENFVFPRPSFDVGSSEPAVASFVRGFRTKYGRDPDIYAAHGYDSLKLIWQAMRDTGESYPDDVQRGLHGLESYAGAAGRTDFDERGDVVRYPTLYVVHGGTATTLEQFERDGGTLPIPGEG
jgi:ABC-type branched-subunit amino acid transport system substrate-binding protein